MVIANHAVRLREVQSAVIEDNDVFGNIQNASIYMMLGKQKQRGIAIVPVCTGKTAMCIQ